jgi:hypothetical protein
MKTNTKEIIRDYSENLDEKKKSRRNGNISRYI